jgi:hypothetical protein
MSVKLPGTGFFVPDMASLISPRMCLENGIAFRRDNGL